mmetsp:Transcript_30032/g.76479  ORF Transcript_30032/g.76479 Transcript_30032/m.76479 type:complete len:277 (-) Transcript_30032:180-1010(-)
MPRWVILNSHAAHGLALSTLPSALCPSTGAAAAAAAAAAAGQRGPVILIPLHLTLPRVVLLVPRAAAKATAAIAKAAAAVACEPAAAAAAAAVARCGRHLLLLAACRRHRHLPGGRVAQLVGGFDAQLGEDGAKDLLLLVLVLVVGKGVVHLVGHHLLLHAHHFVLLLKLHHNLRDLRQVHLSVHHAHRFRHPFHALRHLLARRHGLQPQRHRLHVRLHLVHLLDIRACPHQILGHDPCGGHLAVLGRLLDVAHQLLLLALERGALPVELPNGLLD